MRKIKAFIEKIRKCKKIIAEKLEYYLKLGMKMNAKWDAIADVIIDIIVKEIQK